MSQQDIRGSPSSQNAPIRTRDSSNGSQRVSQRGQQEYEGSPSNQNAPIRTRDSSTGSQRVSQRGQQEYEGSPSNQNAPIRTRDSSTGSQRVNQRDQQDVVVPRSSERIRQSEGSQKVRQSDYEDQREVFSPDQHAQATRRGESGVLQETTERPLKESYNALQRLIKNEFPDKSQATVTL